MNESVFLFLFIYPLESQRGLTPSSPTMQQKKKCQSQKKNRAKINIQKKQKKELLNYRFLQNKTKNDNKRNETKQQQAMKKRRGNPGMILSTSGMGMSLGVRENRAVQDVLESSLEVAVEVRQCEDALVLTQDDVAMLFHDDVVHRQRAGLVRTQHVHRAQAFDGVDPLDHDFFAALRPRRACSPRA